MMTNEFPTGFTPLTEDLAKSYVENHPLRDKFFEKTDTLKATDLADGNVNLVFRVETTVPSNRSVIVKQALPFARRYPDFKMPLERARIEYDVLAFHNEIAPDLCPDVYLFDDKQYINIMEDLRGLKIMREGMLTQTQYPSASESIGKFLAASMFFSSDYFLESEIKKSKVVQFQNPVLTKVTEDLIYTFPFVEHQSNRFPDQIKSLMVEFYENPSIKTAAHQCKFEFMTSLQSLMHGDLHTGSIMVSSEKTKVMDPEFATYGPIAFDIAAVLGNYALAWFSQDFHANDSAARSQFKSYLLESIDKIWQTFLKDFSELYTTRSLPEWRSEQYLKTFLSQLEGQVVKHAACEMIRRSVGMAHILELDTISDDQALAEITSKIVKSSTKLLLSKNSSLQEMLGVLN